MTLGKGGTNCGVLKKSVFDLQGKEIVSIVGSGGKTSLMWALAKKHIEKKLFWLVQPQKLGFPNVNCMIIFLYKPFLKKITPNICGITLAGTAINNQTKTNDARNDLASNIVSALHESF